MADAKLGILLTADTSQATGNISILEKQLERLQKIASLPGLTFTQQQRLNDMLLKTQGSIDRFNRAASLSNPVLQKFNATTTQSTAAMINLGRVVQDAPFGFIGIANNLNPLLESFQRLKVETGSTGGALKALGSSLTGAGGLGLAFSLITAGVSFLSMGFSAWTRGMGGAKKTVDELEKEMEKFNKTIEAQISALDDLRSSFDNLSRFAKINMEIFGGSDVNFLKGQAATLAETVVQPLFDERQRVYGEIAKLNDKFISGEISNQK